MMNSSHSLPQLILLSCQATVIAAGIELNRNLVPVPLSFGITFLGDNLRDVCSASKQSLPKRSPHRIY